MAEGGETQERIADEVGANKATVSRVLHSRQVAETHQAGNDCSTASEFPADSVVGVGPSSSGPFGQFEDSLRGLYKDIGIGVAVPRAVREVARHSKACFEAVRNGERVPVTLVALLSDFVRDSKNHVV